MNFKTEITKIHYDKNAKGFFVSVLEFASLFYGVGSWLKNFLYNKNILKPQKVDAFVVSVGNVTTGGVGKTPVVSEIAKYFLQKGEKVAIVSRGYGGKLSNKNVNVISDGKDVFFDAKSAGDEPFWLAENTIIRHSEPKNPFERAVVLTCKNRYKAARFAVENFGVTHIILDDGFQHRKLHRDIDIVLTDSKMGFGNEKLLPAGPLREGKEAFKRIDRLVVVSKDVEHNRAEKLAKIMEKRMGIPTFVCCTEPDYVYNIKTGEHLTLDVNAEAPSPQRGEGRGEGYNSEISAVCAIGQPEQFFAFLKDYNLKEKIAFDDHHAYVQNEIPLGIVITTEKDAVKMMDFERNDIYALKLKTVVDVEGLIYQG